ncbi:MAG: TonB-dependent receptor [Bacteroidales bacterium]|nr:TonB-dependent receptor [Bacteroidales bacterium]
MKKHVLLILLLLGICSGVFAQTFVMEGVVYDETGETVPGATIYLKDKTGIGTSTDVNGKFSIKAERGDKIVVSFVGYSNVEYLVIEEKKNLEIRFSESAQELEEVVISAFGTTQRKISSVAAVSTVDVKELQVPVASVANLLGGKVAGVFSMQTSGEPGQNISEFWVRGIGTFGASSGALVLIDGLEGDINSIDPADIESFSVLKDASATAVYGVRGANGVVLITTKRGEEGKLKITARANWSLSHLRRVPEYIRSYDYALLANEANEVRGGLPLYRNIELAIIEDHLDPDKYPDVSWQDEILRKNSFKQNYYLSANGGGSVAKYFVSLGGSRESAAYNYDKNSAYASNVGYSTYSFRTNLDIDLTKTSKLFFGTDGFLSIRNLPGVANTDYIWMAQSQLTPLYLPVRYSDGKYPGVGQNADTSPYVLINQTGRASEQNYKGKITMAYGQDMSFLLDGLKFRIQGAYDVQNYFDERRFIQPALYQARERRTDGSLVMYQTVPAMPASYTKATSQFRKYHMESTVNYDHVFAQDHRVSGLIYYYISDQKQTRDATSNMSAIPVRYQGVSSRFTYSFKDTYMMDVNFGYTGSENFQPGHQYGFFPSIALGWVPSSYEWVKNQLPWVDFFKIRASYGTVGNDRLAGNRRFPYMTNASLSYQRVYENLSAIEILRVTRMGADNLRWERALKSDIGIEGRFWGNRISFVVDIFRDKRDGIFQPRQQVPDYVGLTNMPYGNVGAMESFGADGNVSYTQELGKDMSFTVRGNFTYSDNEVKSWEETYLEYPYLFREGFPNDSHRGYQSLGLFKNEDDVRYSPDQTAVAGSTPLKPGDIKYKDVNGDGKIDILDKVPLSRSTMPVLMYGFGGEFRYRKLTVGVLFKGTGKTDYYHTGQSVRHTIDGSEYTYSNGMGYVPFFGGTTGNVLTIANDPHNRWIPSDYAATHGMDPALAENPNARFPRLFYGENINNSQLSDFWKGDARYLRLQEITVSYNLSGDWLRKAKISSIDLQLIGSNIYVWDKVKIFDPEQAQYNGRVYPIPAVYTLQLYINL